MSTIQDYDWTAERVTQLMDLVHSGMSTRLIAFEMGHGLTKGAVQGKISRFYRGKPVAEFPVHPEVVAARENLMACFSAKVFDHGRFHMAKATLAEALQKHVPRLRRK